MVLRVFFFILFFFFSLLLPRPSLRLDSIFGGSGRLMHYFNIVQRLRNEINTDLHPIAYHRNALNDNALERADKRTLTRQITFTWIPAGKIDEPNGARILSSRLVLVKLSKIISSLTRETQTTGGKPIARCPRWWWFLPSPSATSYLFTFTFSPCTYVSFSSFFFPPSSLLARAFVTRSFAFTTGVVAPPRAFERQLVY